MLLQALETFEGAQDYGKAPSGPSRRGLLRNMSPCEQEAQENRAGDGSILGSADAKQVSDGCRARRRRSHPMIRSFEAGGRSVPENCASLSRAAEAVANRAWFKPSATASTIGATARDPRALHRRNIDQALFRRPCFDGLVRAGGALLG